MCQEVYRLLKSKTKCTILNEGKGKTPTQRIQVVTKCRQHSWSKTFWNFYPDTGKWSVGNSVKGRVWIERENVPEMVLDHVYVAHLEWEGKQEARNQHVAQRIQAQNAKEHERKNPPLGKKHARAIASLAVWERKRKLAETKCKKLATRIKRYETLMQKAGDA